MHYSTLKSFDASNAIQKNQCFTGSFIAGAIAIIWLLSSPLAKAETDFSDLDQSKNQPAFHIAFLPYEAERFGFLTPNDYLLFVESYNLTGENFLADLTNFTWLYITLLWPDFGYLKYKRQLNDWDNLNDQMGPPSNEHEAKVRNKVLSLYHDRWKNYPFLSRERLTVSGVFLAYTVLVNVSFGGPASLKLIRRYFSRPLNLVKDRAYQTCKKYGE